MQQPHGCSLRNGRVSIPNQIYLITTVTHRRERIFNDFLLGRIVVDSLRYMEQKQQIESLSYVVMPDHLHWLVSLGNAGSLSKVVADVKRKSAYRINQLRNRIGSPVWQRGFHDHAIRKEEGIRDVARYIVANPLRAGLVKRVGDYSLWDAKWL